MPSQTSLMQHPHVTGGDEQSLVASESDQFGDTEIGRDYVQTRMTALMKLREQGCRMLQGTG